MSQSRAVAVASIFLGVGIAGEPLAPLHLFLAAIIIAGAALALERRQSSISLFAIGFLGTMLACGLQHGELYWRAIVVAFGVGALAAASFGRPRAPAAIATIGVVVGTGVFFLL